MPEWAGRCFPKLETQAVQAVEQKWYEAWFNSPYYFVLYEKRDEAEAARFINNLLGYLKPSPKAKILDLACGTGRHARYLAEKGFDVTGIDLAPNSIEEARQYEQDNLSFYVHDMRNLFRTNYFDYVFNFFTSFGYFDTEKDHHRVLWSANKALKNDGLLVIDYFNAYHAINNMIPIEEKDRQGIKFNIRKYVRKNKIIKKIRFSDKDETHSFEERVSIFTLVDFERYFLKCGFRLRDVFGNYDLDQFHYETSERMILVAEKIQ